MIPDAFFLSAEKNCKESRGEGNGGRVYRIYTKTWKDGKKQQLKETFDDEGHEYPHRGEI